MNNKCLYFHIKETNGEVFYVGIGNKNRPGDKRCRNKHWEHIVNKYGYDILIEETDLTFEQACELEKYWIKRIGRMDLNLGPLVNLTDGGEGSIGFKHTDEAKQKISNAKIGVPQTEEAKLASGEALKGHPVSPETRIKISIALLGKNKGKPSPNKGKTTSEETKLKQSIKKKNVPWTEARRRAQENRCK